MNSAINAKTPIPSSWRGRAPAFLEFNTVINLLDDPVLLVDLPRGLILSANSSLLKFTAFTLAEILETQLLDLLPDISRLEITPGEEFNTVLNRRSREAVEALLRPVALDDANEWFLFTVLPQAYYRQKQQSQERQEEVFAGLQELAFSGSQPDLQSSLNLIMKAGARLLGTNILCLYQADSDFPQFHKVSSIETPECDHLPDILPSNSLMRMPVTALWLPGKKVSSDLQRSARIANLSFLITTPVGQDSAWLGLIAAGDTKDPPPERLVPLMEILAAHITSALDHHILAANLQKHLEENIRSLLFQTTITENAQEGVVLLKPDLSIVKMNPAAELMLGYASHEVVGQSIESVLIGTESIETALRSALQGIATPNLGSITLHRRSGQIFPAHVQTIPVETSDAMIGVAIILSDISENEQIKVRTQQLEQRALLGEVTAIFAHEVRNPVNNISTGLQLLDTRLLEGDPNHELIVRMQHDCNRLTHLMESVLTFSRPMEYKLEPVDLSSLINRMIDRWAPRLSRANVSPFFQADPQCPKIMGDPRALEQVFTNLISNAVQAMSASGGTLAVKIEQPGDGPQVGYVLTSISDTGPGIPVEVKDHIFEPFITTKSQGIGLGLAITKRIITAHKGSISLHSFPGGTVFTVCLPAINGEDS